VPPAQVEVIEVRHAGRAVTCPECGQTEISQPPAGLEMTRHVEFDSIYHEHLCYYSATAFQQLFAQHGLALVDVERLPIHGGSLRVCFQRADGPETPRAEGAERERALLVGRLVRHLPLQAPAVYG